MATTVARLEAILSANTRDFDRAMARSESKMQKTGRVAGLAGLAIAGGLAVGLEKSVKAAMESQVSTARLEQAFRTSGVSADRYAKQVERLESAGRKLGFTDEQTKDSLGSLLVATHSMTKASHDLSVAQNISRFRHVDLNTATKMLTMAMAGSQRATKQLGIDVPKVTTSYDRLKATVGANISPAEKLALAQAKVNDKQATAEKVIDTVRQKLGGQAEAYAKTAAGGMDQYRAQMEHLEVAMGKGLLPALTQIAIALSKLADFFSRHTKLAKILASALGVLAVALLAAASAQAIMNLAVLANPYVAAIAAVVAAGIAIYVFRDKLKNVFDWIKAHYPLLSGIIAGPIGLAVAEIVKHRDRIVTIFTNLPGQIAGAIRGGIQAVENAATSLANGALNAMKTALTGIRDIVTNHIIDPFRSAISDGEKAVKNAVTGLFNKVIGWVKGALGISSPSAVFHQIGQHSIQGFINGVGSMGGVLKHAVVKMAKDAVGSIYHGIGGILHGGGATGNQANRNLGQQLAARYGWGSGEQWLALDALFQRESGWSNTAKNPTSGAYGIAQALPASKYPPAGRESGGSSAAAQIAWGLSYIRGRYGSPLAAMAHEQRFNWYDKGGWLPTGLSLAMNATGKPERVVPPGGDSAVFNIDLAGERIATVVFDLIRRKAKVYENRNGRLAFGGM